jgi:hypothetical protein
MLSFVKLFKIICGLDQDLFTFYGGGKGGGKSVRLNKARHIPPTYLNMLSLSMKNF